jgi:hypothetical protein
MFAVIPDGTAFDLELKPTPVAYFEYEQDAKIYSAQKYHNHVKIFKCYVKAIDENLWQEVKAQ